MIYKILTVIGLATFEIYAAIPAGFAFKLNPIEIFSYSVIGGLFGVFVAAYLGDIIKKWISKLRKNKVNKDLAKIWRYWFRLIGYHDSWSPYKYWNRSWL
jgi:uncharacterized membrane protein